MAERHTIISKGKSRTTEGSLAYRKVVLATWVECVPQLFVDNKLRTLEGNVHGELCGVATVECPETLGLINMTDTMESASMRTGVHLQSLLYYCNNAKKRDQIGASTCASN